MKNIYLDYFPLAPGLRSRRLSELLSNQQEMLHVRMSELALEFVNFGGWFCLRKTRELICCYLNLPDWIVASIAKGILSSCFLDLEVLDLSGCQISSLGSLYMLMSAISKGCPALRRLELRGNPLGPGEAALIIYRSLASGGFKSLEVLDLRDTGIGPGDFKSVAHAMKEGCCPRLRDLAVGSLVTSREGMAVWRDAICGGAVPMLEVVELNWDCWDDDGLWDEVEQDLVEEESVVPIIQQVRNGVFPNLEWLLLSSGVRHPGAMMVAEAMNLDYCQNLRVCRLNFKPTEEQSSFKQHGLLLGQAIQSSLLPHLRRLNLSFSDLGDEGVAAVLEALEAGKCAGLEELNLRSTDMGSLVGTR